MTHPTTGLPEHHRTSLWLLLSFIIIKMIFQFAVLSPYYELHRDEYLHLDMGNHLAAGYLSVPPLTAFNSLLIKWLGNNFFWVKFFPALYGAFTMTLVWKMVEKLGGGWFAQVLAALVFLCSGLSRMNVLYQPNSFDILAWTALFWCLMQWLQTKEHKWLLWMGVVTGIGILNKYNIIFLVIGMAGALALSAHREIYRNKYLYIGIAIALLIIAPNIIWQLQHGLPVLHHMKELSEGQLVHVSRVSFLGDQLLFFMGGAFIVVAAITGLIFSPLFRAYRVIIGVYALTMLLFTYLRAKSYYSVGLYPVLLAFGSVYWERIFTHDWTRYLRLLWVALIVVPFALLANVIFPVLKPAQISEKAGKFKALGLLRWEDGQDHTLPQDFADMLGWRELADMAWQTWQRVPEADRPYTLLICDNYGEAGALNYYNKGRNIPSANAMNADYVFWFREMDTIRYIVKIGTKPEGEYMKMIGRLERTGVMKDTLSREYQWGAGAWLMSGLSPDLPAALKAALREKQDVYQGR